VLKQENSVVKNLIKPLGFLMIAVSLAACSSLRQAELASGNNPQKAVAEVTQMKTAAQQDQIDVLALKEYSRGSAYVVDAGRALERGQPGEKILTKAAIAKAFFQDARKAAEPRKHVASRMLVARKSALSAGVRKSDALVERMMDIDDDLRSKTKQFSRSLSPKDFSRLQKRYLVLETKAVQFRELHRADEAIAQAIEDRAKRLAPKSLRAASLDYQAAMNMIAQSPRDPKIYDKSVQDSLGSATTLVDVMNVIQGAKGTPEHIALQIVQQKRALGQLSTNLKTAQQTVRDQEGKLKRTQGDLQSQKEQLARASTQVRFQQAMDEARKVLPPADALVYQQGNKLVFRLKRVNFRSGAAVIPGSSKRLISNVNEIIEKLDADEVIVQGHTDSVGPEKVNQRLSTKRAHVVANYLNSFKGGYKIKYVGYGEFRPIASNETPAGRATNRRVDLVVSVKQ
jgi:OOP family OmpA-OmpF porin